MKKFLILFFILYGPLLYGQNIHPVFYAKRIYAAPKIDADLSDSVWQRVPVINDFVEYDPHVGKPADHLTEVRIAYDDDAIYVAAQMYDNPDSVHKELTPFDDIFNRTDLIYICFDTYNDDQNAFCFGVSSCGVKEDGKFSEGENYDITLNPVWFVKTKINKDGWAAEYKIPLSSIRFPKVEQQHWGINCIRKIRRTRQAFNCPAYDPKINNIVLQYADLEGINHIEPPLRLAFTPYVSAYYENYTSRIDQVSSDSKSFRGGMDVKWGINESFTLDMTLVPDFGQVKSDNIIYNLTAFETQYDENRPFFTEGSEIFKNENLFYSRRIGGVSDYFYYAGDSTVTINNFPASSQLLNATKITGRTKSNLAVGFLNAVTANTYADGVKTDGEPIHVLVDPMSNYNVLSLHQYFKNSSYIGLFNTNVTRTGKGRDANVVTGDFGLLNKKETYGIYGLTSVSSLFYKNNSSPVYGYSYYAGAQKLTGNTTWAYFHGANTKTFNSNDLGYQQFYDYAYDDLNISLNRYEPKGSVLSYNVNLHNSLSYKNSNFDYEDWMVSADGVITFKNYLTLFGSTFYEPFGSNDFYEPRVDGRFFKVPSDEDFALHLSSDYRKHLALDLGAGYRKWSEHGFYEPSGSVSPRIRIGNRLLLVLKSSYISRKNESGWVAVDSSGIVFGQRNVNTLTNTIAAAYVIRPNINLSLSVRHYWSQGKYSSYHLLNTNGTLDKTDYMYPGDADFNFNAFNIDFGFSWQFVPGSELSIVYKNSINGLDSMQNNFANDFSGTFDLPQVNNLSVRVLYYLDCGSLAKKKRKLHS